MSSKSLVCSHGSACRKTIVMKHWKYGTWCIIILRMKVGFLPYIHIGTLVNTNKEQDETQKTRQCVNKSLKSSYTISLFPVLVKYMGFQAK